MNYSEIISSTNFMGSEPTIRIEGQVALEVYAKIKKAFSKGIDTNSLCFFSSYSGFKIELNHKFEVIFDENNPSDYAFIESELLEVTQQFAFPEQHISIGWKNIIIVRFNPFIPNIIKELPVVDGWFIGKAGIRLSSKTFYEGYKDLYLSGNESNQNGMNNTNKKPFKPFIVDPTLAGDPTHPSEVLVNELEFRKISNQEFANKMEMDIDFLNQFLQAKKPVTPEMALKIESILGIDAGFWLRMQSSYEMTKIRIRMKKQIEKASISNQEKEKLRKAV